MGEEVLEKEAGPLAAERDRLLAQLQTTEQPPQWRDLRHLAELADPARALARARSKPGDMQVSFLRALFPLVELHPRRLVVHHASGQAPAELVLPRRYQPKFGVGVFLRDGEPLE